MKKPVKILHIDSDFQGHYIIVQQGSLIHSTLTLGKTLDFLKSGEFDLVLSEPHHKAVFLEGNKPDQEGFGNGSVYPSTSQDEGESQPFTV